MGMTRVTCWGWVVCVALCALATQASAQVRTQEPARAPAEGDAETDASGEDAPFASSAKEARALYVRAYDLLKAGRWVEAQRALRVLIETHPDDPLKPHAEALLEASSVMLASPRLIRLDGEQGARLDRSGRTEVASYATLYGIWAGVALSVVGELGQGSLLLTATTAGAGLGGALLMTREGEITSAQAALVSAGGNWGTWNGVAFALILDAEPNAVLMSGLAAGLGGITAGGLVGSKYRLDAGDVALVSSGGIWGTFFTGMGLLIAEPDNIDERTVVGVMVAGSDLGLAAGALLGTKLDMSRGRVALIDLGGLMGVLVSGGVLLAADAQESPQGLGVGLGLGAAAGLGLATWATSSWDAFNDADASARRDGATWTLRHPTPFVMPRRGEDGELGVAAGMHMLHGTF